MLSPNSLTFDLKGFPKPVVEVFLKGGSTPALVLMRRHYPRARAGWHERAVEWLEKNVEQSTDYARRGQQRIMFKIGDLGAVANRGVDKPKPGAQVVRVERVIHEGRVLQVRDARNDAKVYYVFSDQLVPVQSA